MCRCRPFVASLALPTILLFVQTRYVRRLEKPPKIPPGTPGRPEGPDTVECTPILRLIHYEKGKLKSGPDYEWDCKMLKGSNRGKILRLVDLENVPSGLLKESESNKNVMTITEAIVTGNDIRIPPGKKIVLEKKPEDGSGGRRLVETTGTRSVLVVRVILSDGSPDNSTAQLSDSVFGTFGDVVNLASQTDDCSFGALNFVPAPNRKVKGKGGARITDGVTEVTVNSYSTADKDDQIGMRIAIQDKLQEIFQVGSHEELADHLMFCLPEGAMSGIAYAYANSWMTTYHNRWCTYLSTQVRLYQYALCIMSTSNLSHLDSFQLGREDA